MLNTGSLSYVTVRPNTSTIDGRAVPMGTYYVAALTPMPTSTGSVLLLWSIVSAAGMVYTVIDPDVVVPVLGPFPVLPVPVPGASP